MPNYVENVLVVLAGEGVPDDELAAFCAANADGGGDGDARLLSFAKAVPLPAEWNETQRAGSLVSAPGWSMEGEYGDEWWRPWCRAHWEIGRAHV